MTCLTFLSGGTGTPKLLDGIDGADIDRSEVSVVVNTGDDIEISGNLVCPDIDTVVYTLADSIDRSKWWGVRGDTHATHDALTDDGAKEEIECVDASRPLGEERAFSGDGEFMRIGDDDRATHILRSSWLDSGATLTEATASLASRFGVEAEVLPVTDDRVATFIETPDGEMHFQVWWVARNGEPAVEDVEFRGADDATTTDAVLDALDAPVVVGPSNPVTSLGPMLAVGGVRDALRETRVVAVSPFVGGEVVSGPAAKLMRSQGLPVSSRGVYEAYSEFIDVLVCDGESPDVDCRVVETETRIRGKKDAARLLNEVGALV